MKAGPKRKVGTKVGPNSSLRILPSQVATSDLVSSVSRESGDVQYVGIITSPRILLWLKWLGFKRPVYYACGRS